MVIFIFYNAFALNTYSFPENDSELNWCILNYLAKTGPFQNKSWGTSAQ